MKFELDGEITKFFEKKAPKKIREAVDKAKKSDILGEIYPYPKRLKADSYEEQIDALQVELVKLQYAAKRSNARLVVLFEGRDAAGKGGCISRVLENMNPRGARHVALAKPSEIERGQWYFQRYIQHLPTEGEIVLFDRSWYNRAVVEHVFGFCTPEERERFFTITPGFERTLVDDGIVLIKIWLTVSRAEQIRRFLAREKDPLKQWKLSPIDVESLGKWNDYTKAIREMFGRTHHAAAPWTVIRSDDKRRARLEVIRRILLSVDYDGRDLEAIGRNDPLLTGDPVSMPLS